MLLPPPDVLPTPGPTAGNESGWDRRNIILEEPLLLSSSRPEGIAPPFIDLPRDVLYKAFREPTRQGQGEVRPTLALVATAPAKLELRSPTRRGPSHSSAPGRSVGTRISDPTIFCSTEDPANPGACPEHGTIWAEQEGLASTRKVSSDPARHSIVPDLLCLKLSRFVVRKTRAPPPVREPPRAPETGPPRPSWHPDNQQTIPAADETLVDFFGLEGDIVSLHVLPRDLV